MTRQTRFLSMLIVPLALAYAVSGASASILQKPVDYIVLDGASPHTTLPIYPKETTAIFFASGIDDVELTKHQLFHWAKDAEVLVLQPRVSAASTAQARVHNRDYDARLGFTLARRAKEARDFVVVLTPEQLATMSQGEAGLQQELRELFAPYEERIAALEKEIVAKDRQLQDEKILRARQYLHDLNEPAQEFRAVQRIGAERESGGPYVIVDRAKTDSNDLQIRWKIHNPQAAPFHLRQVRHRSSGRPERVLDIVTAARPGQTEGAITTVPPGKSVEGAAVLVGVTDSDINGMDLMFVSDSGRQLTAAAIELFARTDQEKEERRRDEEASGRVWLMGVGMAGFLWVPNPSDREDFDAVTMLGAGARVEYGFNRHLSLWGEGIGAQSSSASFGDLKRQATMGRASIGGLVKIGYETITTVRFGIGLQSMRLTTEGQDASYEFYSVFDIGVGVGKRLGDDFVAGASFLVGLGGGAQGLREIQASIYLGYTWKAEQELGQ